MFLLTDLFSGLVRPYNELEVDPPKLYARKNGLRITISQMKCSCTLITLLTRLVGCVRELFVSTEQLTACVVFGSLKTTLIMRYEHYSFGAYTILSNYQLSVQAANSNDM